ncbi:capping complex subunit for YIEGIA [Shimazuella kribbensis]|uniref:capping complex subunit for YIEGIA n=1 Tax=Shimazuella kribbensis TaxID=139808 RepID=UPI00041F3720
MDEKILAIITTTPELVGGASPIFVTKNVDELIARAFLLEKILDAMVHKLNDSTYIIVKH